MKIYDDITKIIGQTPLVRINKMKAASDCSIFAKLESQNPAFSVKDRIAVKMVDDAEKSGKLKPGGTLIEPTSGNTGIGLAFVAAARGYKLILTMPETMSAERRKILEFFGAEVVLTPGEKGMNGAIDKAMELAKNTKGAFIPQQFENPSNPQIHRETTGPEIWNDTEGEVDILVAGIGTGGTLTGAGEFLKSKKSSVRLIAVEPETSAVLSGNPPGRHGIQGIGAGFIPKVLNTQIIDEIIPVTDKEALDTAREAAKKEGIFCGISSGAALFAALKIATRPESQKKRIVVILPDTGERYLSTVLFEK